MKILLPTIAFALAGCQSAPPEPVPPAVAPSPLPPAPPRPPERYESERRQEQLIEALINQNEALTKQLASKPTVAPPERRFERPMPTAPAKPFLVPNAEGVIDLRAMDDKVNAEVNPFEVPRTDVGKGREVALLVSGIIAGTETCAVINERMMQPGDVIETLTVETIARDGVFLALGERRLKLNVSETLVRVRLPD